MHADLKTNRLHLFAAAALRWFALPRLCPGACALKKRHKSADDPEEPAGTGVFRFIFTQKATIAVMPSV